jgi:hypothetical protein
MSPSGFSGGWPSPKSGGVIPPEGISGGFPLFSANADRLIPKIIMIDRTIARILFREPLFIL